MSAKRVIITVDRTKVHQLEEVLERLRRDGMSIERVDTVLDVTHVVGDYEGDLKQLNSDGVVAEPEAWMTEM